jgi:hypothetical protein
MNFEVVGYHDGPIGGQAEAPAPAAPVAYQQKPTAAPQQQQYGSYGQQPPVAPVAAPAPAASSYNNSAPYGSTKPMPSGAGGYGASTNNRPVMNVSDNVGPIMPINAINPYSSRYAKSRTLLSAFVQ